MSPHPQALGWGSGWPNCQANKMATISFPNGLRLSVRREIATLVGWLVTETNRRGYECKNGWCWGYACRSIRGYASTPSNHSWGLAVDINAPTNPMLQGVLRSDMPEWLPGLWKAHGFEWGGDYGPSHWDGHRWVGSSNHRYDGMHLEVGLTPGDIARITADLHSPVASPLVLTKTLHVGAKGPIVGHVQDLLRWYSIRFQQPTVNPGATDNTYGPRTGAAVLAFKNIIWNLQMAFKAHLTFRKPLDNTVGPVTLGALNYWDSIK